jgi:anti-sigma regulatory factor (Ser/Thr protein kinase)
MSHQGRRFRHARLVGVTARSSWAAVATLPADPRSTSRARQITREVLGSWKLEYLANNAVLLVSELVTNAVRHAAASGPTILLRLALRGAWLRIEVYDADPQGPQLRVPGEMAESGFGLLLVTALADKWGADQKAAGKSVWVELHADGGGAPAG